MVKGRSGRPVYCGKVRLQCVYLLIVLYVCISYSKIDQIYLLNVFWKEKFDITSRRNSPRSPLASHFKIEPCFGTNHRISEWMNKEEEAYSINLSVAQHFKGKFYASCHGREMTKLTAKLTDWEKEASFRKKIISVLKSMISFSHRCNKNKF